MRFKNYALQNEEFSKRVVVPASVLAATAEHLPGSPFLIANSGIGGRE